MSNKLLLFIMILFVGLLSFVGFYIWHFANLPAEEHLKRAVVAFDAKDFRSAERHFTVAADKGNAEAQYRLALLYDQGNILPENLSKSLKYIHMSAKQNHPDALYALGVFLSRGYEGNPDEVQIISYYEKAATLGNISAMKSLISFYLMGGDTIAPDREKAQYWKEQLQKVKK